MALIEVEFANFNDGKTTIWYTYDDTKGYMTLVRWVTDRTTTVVLTVNGVQHTFTASGSSSQTLPANQYPVDANGTPAFNVQIAY